MISSDGELFIQRYDYVEDGVHTEGVFAGSPRFKHENYRWVKIEDFHGLIRFYTFTDGARPSETWHEYVAKFTDGQLVDITTIRSLLDPELPTGRHGL